MELARSCRAKTMEMAGSSKLVSRTRLKEAGFANAPHLVANAPRIAPVGDVPRSVVLNAIPEAVKDRIVAESGLTRASFVRILTAARRRYGRLSAADFLSERFDLGRNSYFKFREYLREMRLDENTSLNQLLDRQAAGSLFDLVQQREG